MFGPVYQGSPHIHRVPWMNDQQEYRDKMIDIKPDIGICAVRDSNFSDGKSDIKVLEYGLVGALPIISPLTLYKDWIDKLPSARNSQEWMEAIKWAINNKEEVRAKAEEHHKFVVENRTIKTEAQSWLDAVAGPLGEIQ